MRGMELLFTVHSHTVGDKRLRFDIFMKSKYVMWVSELEIGTITLDIGLREEAF
ncbi:hypothetical protein ABH892_005438 [Paenibacillus sp. RC254]